ncbi:hypothetical protein GFY24_40095 [Nocardia sp. SYP-A9097]|uniref:hypothetical protein n=1 Tax=Nocardia sp. SYP-A9097 TaxID=2663237 RepID=UPI00129AACA4|nr:hypothetical protein [Nocardia sp. SYP-A9097]MRH93530.1 hypothetical protein [Nocardia sp. SYP-A9097]
MSTLTALARAAALDRGRAQPIATVRHSHIAEQPMVCIPLTMAGEANAPLAFMAGTERESPRLWVVPQPRARDLRLEFAGSLALTLHRYIGTYIGASPAVTGSHLGSAPQLWVPNHRGIDFLRLLGRSTRFRSTTGPHAVGVAVPRLGMWLTYFAEQAERAGSSLLLAATDVIGQHWASGQSAVEDENLAALMAWIDPAPGSTAARGALEAEDPLLWPPAGPTTDPGFDREVLAPCIAEYDRAGTVRARRRALSRIESALRGQLDPTWQMMWQAIDQLRELRPGAHVAQRWARDVDAFGRFNTYMAEGGVPQPKRDSPVAAAVRLNELERCRAEYDAQRAFDDPLVMAEFRLIGEAFAGTVTSIATDRRIGAGRHAVLRPLATVVTSDPVRFAPGDGPLTDPARPQQKATVISVEDLPDGVQITLELASGMGRADIAPEGSVPTSGQPVCYGTLNATYQPRGSFPSRQDTPWTHGGSTEPPTWSVNDADEEWS